jgi:SAM-dependent methyltransferase
MLAEIMPVQTSNLVEGAADRVLDMTALDLPDASVPLLMSAFAIEHFFEVDRSMAEAARVLQPGGAYFLIAPFLYYYHAAPDDYFRFTAPALKAMGEKHGLAAESTVTLGDRWLMFAEFLHEKEVLGSRHGRFGCLMLRLLALPMLAYSVLRGRPDSRFAMGYAVLLRKPAEAAA